MGQHPFQDIDDRIEQYMLTKVLNFSEPLQFQEI